MAKEKKNYIDADEFLNEVIQSQTDGKCTEKLGQLLLVLHDHILTTPRFVNKPKQVKDEIKSFSIYRILKRGILTFDTSSTSKRCFNYFSTAAILNMTRCCQMINDYAKRMQDYTEKVFNEYRAKQKYSLV